jgi:hypothetical protein
MAHIVMIDTETDFKDAPDRKLVYLVFPTRAILTVVQNQVAQRVSTEAPSALRTSNLISLLLTWLQSTVP